MWKKKYFNRYKNQITMKTDWIIYRIKQDSKGTISANFINTGDDTFNQFGYNVELPYESNSIMVSAIPSGIYAFEKRVSDARGEYLAILNVPNRTAILVHVGNFMKDTNGCVLPCLNWCEIPAKTEYMGTSSRTALRQLYRALPSKGMVHIVGIA